MELGKAKYGQGKKVFKIKDGDNIFRILPPMGKLAKKGFWNQYYRVEWGYKNTAGKNRPFQDVRVVNFNTKMVEVESAAHLRREALKESKAALVMELRKNPTDKNLKNKIDEISEAIKLFNLDAKYYMNAIDLNGEIGLLKLGSRAFKDLKLEIDKLRKKGVDPLSVEGGRFFNFNRSNATGNFQDTAYKVTLHKELVTVNGETYEKDLVHKLDASIIDRLSEEAYELSGMFPEVTASQVEAMVKGGAAAVDQILGAGDTRSVESEDEETLDTSSFTTVTLQAATVLKESSTLGTLNTDSKGNGDVTLTNSPLTPSTLQTGKATTADTKATEATVIAAATNDLSDDEFLKSIGALR